MPKYKFGNALEVDRDCVWECTAKNLNFAIKLFKVSVLFPEQNLDYSFFKNGHDWDEVMDLHRPKEIPDNAFIPIYEWTDEIDKAETKRHEAWRNQKRNIKWKNWYEVLKPITTIPLTECVNVDYNILTDTKLLPAPVEDEEGDDEEEKSTALIIKSNQQLQEASAHKMKARQWMTDITKLRAELEKQRYALSDQISAFEKMINQKRKQLFAIETYAGVYEDVFQLKEGIAADEKEPIYIYQMKLFMDEEIGLTEVEDSYNFYEGLDFQSIEKFDEWISYNYEKFLYKPKSIMAWEVRRKNKRYDDNVVINDILNAENHRTYFLIRNGNNLYRIDSNISIGDSTFPVKGALEKAIEEDKRFHNNEKRIIQQFVEKYMYTFIALQGLIDRTSVFGNYFQGKVDLINPRNFNEEYVKLIRDNETTFILKDKRPDWYDYKSSNSATVVQGSRVFLHLSHSNRWNYKNETCKRIVNGNAWKSLPFTPLPNDGIYIVEEVIPPTKWTSLTYYKIKYLPNDEVYVGNRIDYYMNSIYQPRKKSLSFKCHSDELMNLDEMTYDDISYYINCRLYRECYLEILPLLKTIYMLKKEEEEKEQPFIDLMSDKFNYKNKKELRKMVNYWKLKNKWKRFITDNEPLAYRMIERWVKKSKEKQDWRKEIGKSKSEGETK